MYIYICYYTHKELCRHIVERYVGNIAHPRLIYINIKFTIIVRFMVVTCDYIIFSLQSRQHVHDIYIYIYIYIYIWYIYILWWFQTNYINYPNYPDYMSLYVILYHCSKQILQILSKSPPCRVPRPSQPRAAFEPLPRPLGGPRRPKRPGRPGRPGTTESEQVGVWGWFFQRFSLA